MSDKANKFIEKARKIFCDKYDYSNVNYIDVDTKVCIICPIHGEFWITPHNLLRKKGCPKCKKEQLRIDEEKKFIEKAKKIHLNKYDYSKVNYNGATTKVCIICPIHGEFWQSPNVHLTNHGCPMCGQKNTPYTQEEIIEKLNRINIDENGNKKYEILPFIYKNNKQKITFVCKKHGEFTMKISSFLNGSECPKCSHRSYAYTKEEFIKLSKGKHGNKYDYSKLEYKNNSAKICIICPIHGEVYITPHNHLNGCGCPKCSIENRTKKRTKTKEQFIEDSKKIFGDRYDYSKVEYKGNKTKVCLVCKKHGEFWVRPDVHLSRFNGCPQCSAESNILETLLFEHINKEIPNLNLFHSKRDLIELEYLELDMFSEKYKIAIEYQGDQHFIPIKKFGGEEALIKQKERDLKKINLCNKNNIKLFHFSYNKNMIEKCKNYKLYTNETELINDILKYTIKEQQ